jgi:glycosyltransferase involved in cell wall biosynthesis
VGWKVNSLMAGMASVRYRALLPAAALEAAGVRCRVFSAGAERRLEGLDTLVIVKSFTPDDLRLAQAARARGVRVLFDLCDNVFVDGYGGRTSGLTVASMFLCIARLAHCVVVTTEPLAAVVRQHLPGVRVEVIPDGIEGPADEQRMTELLRVAQADDRAQARRLMRQRMGNALRLVRSEGIQVIPDLIGSVARHVRGAVALRMRRGPHATAAATEATPAAAPDIPAGPGTARIVWFGNHGAGHGRFGMLDILEFRGALEAVARERAIELVVISNNRAKFEADIRPIAVPTRYVEWSPSAVREWLRVAALVIIPNTRDPFSLCKSANRTVLALASGVPVVATPTPALEPLAGFVHTGDPLAAFRAILADPAAARAQAQDGYRRAEALFGTAAVRGRWLRLLEELPQAPEGPREESAPPVLTVVLHLVQDLDLALPILREARGAGLACEAWCSAELFGKSPRVLAFLQREGFPLRVLPESEQALRAFRFAPGTRALLTIAETSLGPHRVPRALTEAALRQGVFAATLQHGFENVGLTYEDTLHAIDKVTIAAQRIYTWGPAATLHPRIGDAVRARCVPVGCPKDADVPAASLGALLPADRPVVGLFENLHWHRYSSAYRAGFVEHVESLAQSFPQVFFLVKPHHAGVWLSRRYEGERPAAPNLLIADPQSPDWEHHTAAALLPHLSAVITTPSTVAMDAARKGLPVAVVAGDLQVDSYAPLPLLVSGPDWREFVAGALEPGRREALRALSGRFVERVLVPGNAARRIVEDLRLAVQA